MDNKHMVSVVERYMDAFNEKDISIIRDMYADDAVVEDPVGTDPYVGIDAILGFYEGAINTGPALSLNGQVRCAGNSAAFPFQARMGDVTIDIIDVFDFNDEGKVINMRAFWGPDNMSQG
jgi:steroid delta-isomerase